MTFMAYIHSSGTMIVRRYMGPHEEQELRRVMRQKIGTFEAPDIERARSIANQLRKATV